MNDEWALPGLTPGSPATAAKAPRVRGGVFAIIAIAVIVVLCLLAAQITHELEVLRGAPDDNMHWSLTQLEVELLALDRAVRVAGEGDAAALKEARDRFDIFYSRVAGLGRIDIFQARYASPGLNEDRKTIVDVVKDWAPTIDGSDEVLRARLPALLAAIEGLWPPTRRIELESVRHFASSTDASRVKISTLLMTTALVALALILALAGSALVLLWQHRISTGRSREIVAISQRYESAINASLDAIIVTDDMGVVLDFNPAAERTFGYSRAEALGADIDKLIAPGRRTEGDGAGVERFFKLGASKILNRGRVTLEAKRADGEVFPVELSLGKSRGPQGPIFIGYVRDVSDQLRAQRELTQARDEALAAARAKSQFLAVMSHEMRTPLNGVLAIIDILASSSLSEKQARFVRTAIHSGEMLQRHINDVLEITHLDAGQLRLRPSAFELEPLLREVVAINAPAAAAHGDRIVLEIHSPLGLVVEDPQRLSQVLVNLVSNAVKFTRDGVITIRGARVEEPGQPPLLRFSVQDTGVGIAEADQKRIFEDFVSLDSSYRRTTRGYGLGLAICRRIVQAMDGTIGVESQLGVGSRFWVNLPYREAPVGAATHSELQTVTRHGEGMSVLLVEDNETNRLVAREMLVAEGCLVTEAKDGAEGVKAAAERRFDLILMDVSMPFMDGLEATQRIRGDAVGLSQRTPIVGLTAHALPEEQDKFREAGMQDCLIKPLRIRNLHALLNRFGGVQMTMEDSKSPATDAGAYLDDEVLAELRDVLPSDVYNERMAAFREELATIVATMRDLFSQGDIARVGKVAHKIAGAAALFGAEPLRVKLAEIEAAVHAQKTDALAGLIAAAEQASIGTQAAIAKARLA